jgi:hypothetical protein
MIFSIVSCSNVPGIIFVHPVPVLSEFFRIFANGFFLFFNQKFLVKKEERKEIK